MQLLSILLLNNCNGYILRAEFYFYHELTEMGVDTIPIEGMRLEEGLSYLSLWLPRFEVQISEQQIQRFGMESVYFILNKNALQIDCFLWEN